MSRSDDAYDLVVLGGGTAGLVAAAGAASLGADVALLERDRLGGECLWTGCVPSKGLIGSARAAQAMRRAGDFGLEAREPRPDTAAVLESVREVRARVQPHDDPERFRAMGVEVHEGAPARFLSPREVEAGGRRFRGRRFLVATGSRPAVPPVEGLEEAGYFTHESAFDRDALPRSVVVLGGGPIGVELSQAFCRLGVDTSLVEMEERVLPREDRELALRLQRVLEEEGVEVLTGRRAVSARAGEGDGDEGRTVELEGEEGRSRISAAEILVAAGRRPNVEGLGLQAAGVETGPEGVAVDAKMRTTRRHIFAAGDVTGGHLFTHVADHEARTVLRNALAPFAWSSVDYSVVPWAIYSEPELARVGLTEEEAVERHGDAVRSYSYELEELDRAIADRATAGLVKLVADGRGRILGGHLLAPGAGSLVVEVALAMREGARVGDLADLVHPYPTLSEAVRRAANEHYREKLGEGGRRWLRRYFRLLRRLGL